MNEESLMSWKPKRIHPFFESHAVTPVTVSRVKLSTVRKPLIEETAACQNLVSSSDSDHDSDDVIIVGEKHGEKTQQRTIRDQKVTQPSPKWKPASIRVRPQSPNPPASRQPGQGTSQSTAHHQAPISSSQADTEQPITIYEPYQLFFFDLEATGLTTHSARIIDLAVIEQGTGAVYSSLVNIGNSRISPTATEITSITKADLKGQPPVGEVLAGMVSFLESRRAHGKTPVLVAHNGKCYDFKLLIEEASRSNVALPPDWLCLDTLILAGVPALKLKAKTSLNQQALRSFYGIPPNSAHRALPDAEVLLLIFKAIMKQEILPISKGQSLHDVFDSIGASKAFFPLSSTTLYSHKMDKLLDEALEKELSSWPELQLCSLDELTSLLSNSFVLNSPVRTADDKKAVFLIRDSLILYSQSKNQYAYRGLEPQWVLQLDKSPDVDLTLSALPAVSSKKNLPVNLNCSKSILNGQVSWSLKTQLIDLKTQKLISVNLDSTQIDSSDLEEVKRGNLEKLDEGLRWSRGKKYNVLVEVQQTGLKTRLNALLVFIS